MPFSNDELAQLKAFDSAVEAEVKDGRIPAVSRLDEIDRLIVGCNESYLRQDEDGDDWELVDVADPTQVPDDSLIRGEFSDDVGELSDVRMYSAREAVLEQRMNEDD